MSMESTIPKKRPFIDRFNAFGKRRHVPIIKQNTQTDCGAACLAMILNYHGHRIRLNELKKGAITGRDGLNAKTIAEVARSYGLRVKAYAATTENLQWISLPAIIHWRLNHFVILEHWSEKGATIIDPSLGRYKPSQEEFDQSFTGVTLVMEPSAQFQKRDDAPSSVWGHYLSQLVRLPGLRPALLQVLGVSLLLQSLGLIFPLATKLTIDHILPNQLNGFLSILGIGIGLLFMTQFTTLYLRSTLLIYLQGRLDSQMMLGFFDHLLKLPFRFFQERATGDLLHRLGSNGALREIITAQSLSTLLDGTFVLVYLTILWSMDLLFGLVATLIGLAQVGILWISKTRVDAINHQHLQCQGQSQSYFVEALSGIETVKASGMEDQVMEHWSNLFFKQLNTSLKRNHLTSIVTNGMSSVSQFAPLLLLWIGIHRVFANSMSLGTMFALLTIATAFLIPLVTLVTHGQQFQFISAHLARLGEILEAEPEPEPPNGGLRMQPRGHIQLKNLSFRYGPQSPWVLRNIDLNIEPGQKVGIVGPTGSGKSTLAKLLLSLYQPTDGELLIDQHPLSAWHLKTLRQHFGVVPQHCFLFSGSIRRNIALNQPDMDLISVIKAAQAACIHDEIMDMPMEYDTLVGEGGQGFSGGQRQRLAIARALAHEPPMLLLDEATSHLDTVTEQRIESNLKHLANTRIVIAHRLSTIRDADNIVVLDQGTIVEQGNHKTLMEKRGHYANLVSLQAFEDRENITSVS